MWVRSSPCPLPTTTNEKRGLQRPLRAENGIRTRDPQLGKLMLYRLSYFRVRSANIRNLPNFHHHSANFYFLRPTSTINGPGHRCYTGKPGRTDTAYRKKRPSTTSRTQSGKQNAKRGYLLPPSIVRLSAGHFVKRMAILRSTARCAAVASAGTVANSFPKPSVLIRSAGIPSFTSIDLIYSARFLEIS